MKDKVAIVTGASRGIGRAVAISLASEGFSVVLAARDREVLARVAGEIEQAGGRATVVPTELTEEDAIRSLVEVTDREYARLDLLVNNAGIVPYVGLLADTETRHWDQCMAVNARAPFILCRESLPLLKRTGGGRIINICSVVGVKGYAGQSAYTASKHALRGMSISLAEELHKVNIRVHVICPGGVDTDMISGVRPDIDGNELIKPEEIAELVLYLATHKGNAVIDELHIRRNAAFPWF